MTAVVASYIHNSHIWKILLTILSPPTPNPATPGEKLFAIMNRILDIFGAFAAEMDKHFSSKSSKLKSSKRHARSGKGNDKEPLHFYDPDAPKSREESTGDLRLSKLKRKQADTWARIEGLEGILAREKKREEQPGKHIANCKAEQSEMRRQQDDEPFLTDRDRNCRAYEKELAGVQRDTLSATQALYRRFAHSDKVMELKMARQATKATQREVTQSKKGQQRQNGGSIETEARNGLSAEQQQQEAERRETEHQPQHEEAHETVAQNGPPNGPSNV